MTAPVRLPAPRRPVPGSGILRQTGQLMTLAATTVRDTFRRPFQVRELIEQFWFVASVTILPAALVSIPFGAVIALQVGSLTQQLGAQSFTGGASVLAVIQQASPLIVALLIAGAGGSAICADLGSRKIREELDAIRRSAGAAFDAARYDQAVALFTEVGLADYYVEFLTIPAYERMP